jgi:hypothetical protein
MKLMGIQPSTPTTYAMQKSASVPSQPATPSSNSNRRFSWFGAKSENSDTSSISSLSRNLSSEIGYESSTDLTQEALEQAEAQNSLAALDAHEKALSVELSRGGGSGFTEVTQRVPGGRRSRRSAGGSGSGSTVWSAGNDD